MQESFYKLCKNRFMHELHFYVLFQVTHGLYALFTRWKKKLNSIFCFFFDYVIFYFIYFLCLFYLFIYLFIYMYLFILRFIMCRLTKHNRKAPLIGVRKLDRLPYASGAELLIILVRASGHHVIGSGSSNWNIIVVYDKRVYCLAVQNSF